ncbi:unnamed protein product, partial [Effrenium voratum]
METNEAVLLAVCAMFLWGSWANTLLLFRDRFELYLLDYAFGHLLAGCVGLQDAVLSLRHVSGGAGVGVVLASGCAGVLFAIGSLLCVASIDLAGMALPTLVMLSVEMALGVPLLLLIEGWGTAGHVALTLSGVMAVLLAALFDGWCHWSLQCDRARAERAERLERFERSELEALPGQCLGLSSQFSSLSFWSFRASLAASDRAERSAAERSADRATATLSFLAHGSIPSLIPQVRRSQRNVRGERSSKATGLALAACGGACFALWPCVGSLVEGQGSADCRVCLRPAAFFLLYAAGAVLAALAILPPICRWPLHSG